MTSRSYLPEPAAQATEQASSQPKALERIIITLSLPIQPPWISIFKATIRCTSQPRLIRLHHWPFGPHRFRASCSSTNHDFVRPKAGCQSLINLSNPLLRAATHAEEQRCALRRAAAEVLPLQSEHSHLLSPSLFQNDLAQTCRQKRKN